MIPLTKFLRIPIQLGLLCGGVISCFGGSFSFATDILPVLTKAGCNTGECHGAATGQGGLRLSLLGYDPAADYEQITREYSGRRVDLGDPAHSLFLQKPTKQVKHKGGRVFKVGSAEYEAILNWIEAGASTGDMSIGVSAIYAKPADIRLLKPNQSAAIKVFAKLTDGSQRNVTEQALYNSNDDGLAEVDELGNITMLGRGVSSIMIRYGGKVAAARVGVPLRDEAVERVRRMAGNFIDKKVLGELERWNIPVSTSCEQSEFFRRVHLDLIGRPPGVEAVEKFLSEEDSPKVRAAVVDELLQHDGFIDLWTMRLADLLLVNSKKQGPAGSKVYHGWLREQVAANTSIARITDSLLTSSGNIAEIGPANFYRMTSDPRDMAEFVSRTFLGVRVACARCHNHPFDQWSMNDYYEFAAYFAHTAWEGNRIVIKNRGDVRHPKTKQVALPKPLGVETAGIYHGSDRREDLVAWLTAPDNPYFARAFVNRVWKHLIGRGIIEPVDDVRVTNPPSNSELLNALAEDFVENGFDLRQLVRRIANSQTYQRSSRVNGVNRHDERFFSRAYLKPLAGQVLSDAITKVTGQHDRFGDDLDQRWATQLHDPQVESYTLDVFGRCPRTDSCEAPENFGGGLTQALHFINSDAVNRKLRGGVVPRILEANKTVRERVQAIYLRTLSRYPTETESVHWERQVAETESKAAYYEDLLWALINSREFAFNH